MTLVWVFLAILACLVAEGFFSGSEIAIVSINRVRLRSLVAKGNEKAKMVAQLLRNPEWLLGTTLLGTNVSTVTAGTLATYVVITLLGEQYSYVAIIIMAPIILIFSEIVPKTIAHVRTETFALSVVGPLHVARTLLKPLVWLLARVSKLFTATTSKSGMTRSPLMTREDLEFAIRSAGQRGGLKAIERQMIHRIFEFQDTTVDEVMIPLIEVVALAADAKVEDAVNITVKQGISRIPIYQDRVDNIVGVLVTSDLLFQDRKDAKDLSELMRPPVFVPESKPIKDMLQEFRRSSVNLAVVVDEYGGAVGIVTVEDILEEVVGEIEDEYDRRKQLYKKIRKNLFVVDPRIEIDRLRELLGIEIPAGDYETLAGFLLTEMKRIPKVGERVRYGTYTFRVTDATDRAIEQVQISIDSR